MPPRSGSWRERLLERWREGVRHKITALGAMMVALLVASGTLAFATAQNVFFLLFSLLLASILISSFVNRLMLAGLGLRFALPAHPMAGEQLPCVLTIENEKRWLASFALEVVVPVGRRFHLPCVSGAGRAAVTVDMTWERRGVPAPVTVELSTRFPFGFSVRKARVRAAMTRAIYPSIAARPGFAEVLAAARNWAGAQGATEPEFSHLREYVAGDDRRRIAWGKSAARPHWIVKEMAGRRDARPRVWLDLGSPQFERLVELAAYLIWELCCQGTAFDFALGQSVIGVTERNEAYTVLKLLAEVAPAVVELPYDDQSLFVLSLRDGFVSLPRDAETVAAGADQRNGV